MSLITPEFRAEILAWLQRSGYLLESRLVRLLSEARFFVEPNVAVLDRVTGKSREIDLLAEFYEHRPDQQNISVRTLFAVEAINNPLPLVLMTEHPESPITDIDGYVRYATTPANAPFETRVDVYEGKGVFGAKRYSQYCGLSRKKQDEALMASHHDELYSSFVKLAQFIEQQMADFESREWPENDDFWRISLVDIDEAPLVFNYHAAELPKTILIHVVRESQLLSYARRLVEEDSHLAEKLQTLRTRSSGGDT
jgi:hypothetical protein